MQHEFLFYLSTEGENDMRKSRAVLGLFMAAAVGMTGCSASGEAGAGSTAQTPRQTSGQTAEQSEAASGEEISYEVTGPVEFEFWHSMETELIDPICEAFNSSEDQITVTPVYVGNYAAIQEQIAAAQAAREGLPGLCTINYPFVNTYAESGVAEPLDAYMEAAEYEDLFYEGFTDPVKIDGQQYAFPWGPSTTVIYYNKDLLEESGTETYPATWEELRTWTQEYHEKTGGTAFAFFGTDFNYINTLLLNTGVDPIGDGKCQMGDERIRTWIAEEKEMVDSGAAEWVNTGSSTEADLKTKFLSGETASIILTSTYYDKALAAAEFEVGVSLVPYNAKNNSTTSGATLFIPAMNDQNIKNAAFEFLTYMTNDENAKEFALYTAYLPTKKSLLDSEEEVDEFCERYPEMRIVYENMDTIISKNPSPYFTKALTQICEDLTLIFNTGADIDSTIESMCERVDYILEGN